ncbi:RagB/SusD family nutrient uptake outer membrane protein [Pedobacter puniceum]|uniref:RagB/SusD family nutrient uptake outer membrane protein n=1 Tax=Pedobacter puniceum TaxID=2666136 RepID=A0A7K0FNV3_9SPHI|nr:RagB/SusD family nutrient uptake outer membrane protein [Pedobacter puniceum]MRX46930.1 RagB/SusD family nutrient uptake outer membrane protein [Pedobacter puniceum]
MKNIFKYSLALLFSTSFFFLGTGCKKILNPEPIGEQTLDVNFTTFNGSLSAVNGIYAQLTNGELYRNGNALMSIDYASDDVQDAPKTVSSAYNLVDYFELPADNIISFRLWDNFYRVIYRSNVVIERIPGVNFPTAFINNGTGRPFKDQFLGEAHFLRAFAYFNLVRIFGGVPLHTKEIKSATEVNIPRSSVEEVYAQIEKDLNEAVAKLPLSYNNTGDGNERGRVTRWSALAMLADVYLTQRKFELAKTTALDVINNGAANGISLNTNYRDNFFALNGGQENTRESLFEIQFSNTNFAANQTAPQGNNFANLMGPVNDIVGGVASLARYHPTDNNSLVPNESGFSGGLIQEYQTGDLRLNDNFILAQGGQGSNIYLTKKFYEPGRGTSGAGNYPVYRLAEVYLIYAEATTELGEPDALSINLVNQLRRRAFGLPLTTPSVTVDVPSNVSQSAFRDIIRSESRKEFAMENKRWFNLLRYGFDYMQDVLVNKQKKTLFNRNKMLFPIAQIELINNPLLVQNPL